MATLGNPGNTIEVLQKYNFNFQKKFGQNFLIDTHVLDKIIRESGVTKDDMVIEANRIIEESMGARNKEKRAFAPGFLYPFLIGAATSFVVLSAVLFIFSLF